MRIEILAANPNERGHALTGFLVNGRIAVDAGPMASFAPVQAQAEIDHILLTHSHIDHVAGLPILLDSVYGLRSTPPQVYALPSTLDSLQRDIFNNRLMPDFIEFSRVMTPFVELHAVEPNRPFAVDSLIITPIPVDHTVPTVAYLLDDCEVACAVVTDTAPVPAVMAELGRLPRLRAVFLECSFPRRMNGLAEVSRHLHTGTFAEMVGLLPAHVRVYATHIKPHFYDEVCDEIAGLNLPNVQIGTPGTLVSLT